MKVLLVLLGLVLGLTSAVQFVYPYSYGLPYAPVTSQFHSQDSLGHYSFGHASPGLARVETRGLGGGVAGSYSYVDPNHKVIQVNYVADAGGFRVTGANNLPEAPTADLKGPEPVKDTPEVSAAKVEFQRVFDAAKTAADDAPERKKRDVFAHHGEVANVKVQSYKTVDAATPADTKKLEVTEQEVPVVVHHPSVYSYVGYPYVNHPVFYRKKRETFHAAVPAVATAKIKVHSFEPVEADTPADTQKIELKETEHDVHVPVVTYSVHTPYYPYYATYLK